MDKSTIPTRLARAIYYHDDTPLEYLPDATLPDQWLTRARSKRPDILYVIGSVLWNPGTKKPASAVKIGITSNLESRMQSIQVHFPAPCHLLNLTRFERWEDAVSVERRVHKDNAHLLIRGEWFWMTGEEAFGKIDTIRQNVGAAWEAMPANLKWPKAK